MKLSIIVPCKNEEGNVGRIYEAISNVLTSIKYEIIYVDDGSTDKTLTKLHELYEKDMIHVKVLAFSRNFKKEAAMYAGLEYACGEYTCIIDGDLQQNPSYLVEMLEFLDQNSDYDEVAMVMKTRSSESKLMSYCKKKFYKLINKLSDVPFEENASDFRMFRANVKETILSLKEKNRFLKGIFAWVGFPVKYLYYEVEERSSGESKFNLKNSLIYALEGIVAFSTRPLFWAMEIGIFLLICAVIYLFVLIIRIFVLKYVLQTVSLLIFLILVVSGLQLLFMGILGFYFSKLYSEIKNRPIYILKEKIGFQEDTIL